MKPTKAEALGISQRLLIPTDSFASSDSSQKGRIEEQPNKVNFFYPKMECVNNLFRAREGIHPN